MIKSILIIKTSAIGDVIQAFCVLELLTHAFPEARIDWVVEGGIADLVRAHPSVKNVLPIYTKKWKKALFSKSTYSELFQCIRNLRKSRYDVVFDLQGNCKSGVINLLVKSGRKIGFDETGVAEWPNLWTTHEKIATDSCRSARDRYQKLILEGLGLSRGPDLKPKLLVLEGLASEKIETLFSKLKRPVFVVGFGSRWGNKKIDKAVFKSFLERIKKNLNAAFIFPYTAHEKKEAEFIAENLEAILIEDYSLIECQHIIDRADGFIGVDSALLHLAQSTQTPVFGIFGPSLASFYMKEGKRVGSYQGGCPYGKKFGVRCDILRSCINAPCTQTISADRLAEAFFLFWNSIVLSLQPG